MGVSVYGKENNLFYFSFWLIIHQFYVLELDVYCWYDLPLYVINWRCIECFKYLNIYYFKLISPLEMERIQKKSVEILEARFVWKTICFHLHLEERKKFLHRYHDMREHFEIICLPFETHCATCNKNTENKKIIFIKLWIFWIIKSAIMKN